MAKALARVIAVSSFSISYRLLLMLLIVFGVSIAGNMYFVESLLCRPYPTEETKAKGQQGNLLAWHGLNTQPKSHLYIYIKSKVRELYL